MATKQKGLCPFCQKTVSPNIIEENTIRRDRCKCPECAEEIYLCRTPGCHDYAKGTEAYDHEFCPACTDKISEATEKLGSIVADIAVESGKAIAAAAVAILIGKMNSKGSSNKRSTKSAKKSAKKSK